jgi:hypothetical protein
MPKLSGPPRLCFNLIGYRSNGEFTVLRPEIQERFEGLKWG